MYQDSLTRTYVSGQYLGKYFLFVLSDFFSPLCQVLPSWCQKKSRFIHLPIKIDWLITAFLRNVINLKKENYKLSISKTGFTKRILCRDKTVANRLSFPCDFHLYHAFSNFWCQWISMANKLFLFTLTACQFTTFFFSKYPS